MASDPIDGLPPLREIIADYGLAAQKKLGQHFLLDSNLTDRIARTAGDLAGKTVIEVGPGPGGLTRSLLRSGADRVVAVEKDGRCVEALQSLQQAANGRLTLVEEDALVFDPAMLGDGPHTIVSNLPYNVSSPLLISWLQRSHLIEGMTLMFQKEVADRLSAQPSTKAYGRLSVMTQWRCDVSHLFNVDKRAFTPPPKVMSSVVSLKPKQIDRTAPSWNSMEKLVAAAFNQRRKMLRTSLCGLNLDFDGADIDPSRRAATLTVADYESLARQID